MHFASIWSQSHSVDCYIYRKRFFSIYIDSRAEILSLRVLIQEITQPILRYLNDTLVQATIIIEFFQLLAITLSFYSFKIVIQAASKIFMLDIIK